jgi:hypothetical protein
VTRKILITSAAALLAGTVLAGAQEHQRNQPGAQPGAAQEHGAQSQGQREQKGPAAPNSRAQDRNQGQRPSTTGQGQREEPPGQRREQGQAPGERREGQDNNRRERTQGQNDRDRREEGRNQRDDRREGRDNRRDDRREGRDDRRDRTQGQNDRDRNRRDEGRDNRDDRRQGQDNRNDNRDRTQGQGPGRAGASVTLTSEQRTRIRETVLVGRSVPRVRNVNFSINVGVAVPRSVHLVRVPSLIVEYHPDWRGFMYFVYEDEIIIVDPNTHRIVAVLDV